MVDPYSKYQLVEVPFGLIDPFSVAELDVTELAGLVLAVGADAASADCAENAKIVMTSARVFFMVLLNTPGR